MQDHSFPEKRSREKKLIFVETKVHGKRRWKLNGYYLNGGCTRNFFLKKVDGVEFIDAQGRSSKELGERAATVPGWLHEQAVEAHRIVAPHNMSILDAAMAVGFQAGARCPCI